MLKTLFPDRDYAIPDPVCGHAWLAVNGNADEAAGRCRALGVEVVPASLFAVGRHCPDNIRISLSAAHSLQQLKMALETLREANIVRQH